MVHLRKKLRHHLSKNKSVYSVGLFSLFLVFVFLITRGVNPSVSELAFIEKSSTGVGSVIPASCDSATPFNSPTAAGGTAGSHYRRDCQTACPWGGMYDPYFDSTASTCPAPASCTGTPWGTVVHGGTRTGYTVSSVAWDASCPASATVTCTNGSLNNPDYRKTSCAPEPRITDLTITPSPVISGQNPSVYFNSDNTSYCYLYITPPGGSESTIDEGAYSSKTISMGVKTTIGDYNVLVYCWGPTGLAASKSIIFNVYNQACSLPWGGTTPHAPDTAIPAYSTASVAWNASCPSPISRYCTNGSFSGDAAYSYSSCTVTPPLDCTLTPWGTVAHTGTKTGYSSASVYYGSTCSGVSETRTCTNGSLSGSYTITSCSVLPAPLVVTLTVDTNPVYYKKGTTLNWTKSGTISSCTLFGGRFGEGEDKTSVLTETTGNLTSEKTYTLICYDGGGNSSSKSVTVDVKPAPTVSGFGGSTIYYKKTASLSWTRGGTSDGDCNIDGVARTSPWTTPVLTSSTNYSIICYDAVGNASNQITSTITVRPPPSADSFSATPTAVPYNTAATLSWTASGTIDSGCYLYGGTFGFGVNKGTGTSGSAGTGNLTNPSLSQAYTLTCYDKGENSSSRDFTEAVGRAWGATDTSVDSCVISQGDSTCPITFTWTSYGLNDPDFAQCGYSTANYGVPCSGVNGNAQFSLANGNVSYNVSGNGTYTRIAGAPDYLAYQAVASKNAIGVCTNIAQWNNSICLNPVPNISLNPTNTSVVIDQPISFTVTSSDFGPDMTEDSINWKAPNQSLWNWENSNAGASVTPSNGHITFTGTASKVTTYTFAGKPSAVSAVPSMPGVYKIYGAVFDSANGGRWNPTPEYTLTVNCTAGYIASNYTCINPRPVVTRNPTGTITTPINVPYTFSSSATDASSDIVVHNFEWVKPNGEYNWEGADPQGEVTYIGSTAFGGTGNNSLQSVFTPSHTGQYKIRFATRDNTLSNYNLEGGRWTYSDWTYVNVIIGVSGIIGQNPVDPSKLKWECFNSNKATLVTTNGPTGGDFTNINLPPNSGNITPAVGATYTLSCTNTIINETRTFSYTQPTLSVSNVGNTNATLTFNCNNPNAKSIVLERIPGSSVTLNVTSGNRTDLDLSPFTEYKYTLRCFDGLGGTGSQIGTQILDFFTNGTPSNLDMSAYVHAKSTDTSTYSSNSSIVAVTNDGTFDSWSYRITGTAASCVMDQRNDGGEFYPLIPYASDPTGFTFQFSSLSPSDKTSFASGFAIQHDWRLTCTDTSGVKKILIWSLQKSNTFPTVIDASLNLDCDSVPPYPTIAVQCVNSDWYEVKNGAGAVFSSGVGPAATVSLLGEDVYKINCYQGGTSGIKSRDVFRAYSASMCTTRPTELIASPTTIRSGGVTTLTWDISQPSSSCSITATPVCSGTCSQGRIDEAAAVNQQFLTGQTDANDPFSPPGIPRTVLQSIQQDAFNNGVSGKALGKKTLRLKYTTDVTINCVGGGAGGGGAGGGGGGAGGVDAIQKIRILVSNENEG